MTIYNRILCLRRINSLPRTAKRRIHLVNLATPFKLAEQHRAMVARNMRLQFHAINTRHGELVVCSTIRMPDKRYDNADWV